MTQTPRRLHLLGDRTLSGVVRAMNPLLESRALPWRVLDSGYDSWLREMLDPASEPCRDSDAALGFLLSPRLLERGGRFRDEISLLLERLASLTPSRTVLCSNLMPDPFGVMPLVRATTLSRAASEINETLYAFAESNSWFHVVDHLGLALREGLQTLVDPRFEAAAQMYFSPAGSQKVAECWMRVLGALSRPAAKVLVTDLDNTLWHGILGEDGPNGLQMGPSGRGWAHWMLQRALLELKANGVLLAVCSKNNPEEAYRVLAEHPDCLLRPADFSALEIGWGTKAEGIRAIAARLSLGIDSFVFLDDSPFEREQVRQALPEALVIDLPDDPIGFIQRLAECTAFDSPRVTQEDRARSSSYAAEARRQELQKAAASPESFYRSLELRLKLFRADSSHFDRLHQLILKTNQFNLTAERLTPEQFRASFGRPDVWVIGMRVADVFGDSGITGLAIVNGIGGSKLTVSTFLLSCRIIGRTVEHAFLDWLVSRAAAAEAEAVELRYNPTPRNQVALEFLQRSGLRSTRDGTAWTTRVPPEAPGLAAHFVSIEENGF